MQINVFILKHCLMRSQAMSACRDPCMKIRRLIRLGTHDLKNN